MRKIHYSSFHKALHWLSAAVILWALISGFYIALVQTSAELKNWVSFLNVSITTLYLPIFILRLYVTFIHLYASRGMKRTSKDYLVLAVHLSIHATVALVLITGVLMMDRDISVFNVLFFSQPLSSASLIDLFFRIHVGACVALALLLALHIAAVIRHELAGAKVLNRMLFNTSRIPLGR